MRFGFVCVVCCVRVCLLGLRLAGICACSGGEADEFERAQKEAAVDEAKEFMKTCVEVAIEALNLTAGVKPTEAQMDAVLEGRG